MLPAYLDYHDGRRVVRCVDCCAICTMYTTNLRVSDAGIRVSTLTQKMDTISVFYSCERHCTAIETNVTDSRCSEQVAIVIY